MHCTYIYTYASYQGIGIFYTPVYINTTYVYYNNLPLWKIQWGQPDQYRVAAGQRSDNHQVVRWAEDKGVLELELLYICMYKRVSLHCLHMCDHKFYLLYTVFSCWNLQYQKSQLIAFQSFPFFQLVSPVSLFLCRGHTLLPV